MGFEDKNIEYKVDIPKKNNQLKAEIVAFLNSEGGTIYLGADDNGKILEEKLALYSDWEEIIANWITNAFSSNVSELITINPNEKPFRIEVKKGKDKPYFYKDGEGFNAKAVYVRVGSTKRVASFDEIQRMLRQSKSHEYENLTSNEQNLTFKYAEDKFAQNGLIFDKYGLQILTKDNQYNNAALFLSDQNPTISKIAVFQGLNVDTFLDKKEFSGSIMKQLDDILYFSSLSNRKKITISGKPQRKEHLDYPEKALREAIVNCYCHRDWTLSGDIKIEFFDDRLSIYSPGSLPDGLTFENIKMGMVAKRNPIIVNALDKADYIENYATGIRRIFSDYEGFEKQPHFYISENGVIVTLYNRNYKVKNDAQNDVQNDVQNDAQKLKPKQRQEQIVQLFMENKNTKIEEIAVVLKVSKSTAERDIKQLKENGSIEYIGSAKDGYWTVKSKELSESEGCE